MENHNPPLSDLEKKVVDWHLANLEYACAARLELVALHEWDQDDQFEFSGEHCMIERGYVRLAKLYMSLIAGI